MFKAASASVGMKLLSCETPCLLVDLAALERNIITLRDQVKTYWPSVAVRPHAKSHKCREIARLQVEKGLACGVCCQKVNEVEWMADGGIKDIYLSNVIVGENKAKRLAEIAKDGTKISACVDCVEGVTELSKAAVGENVNFDVLVEVDVGQKRCGVMTPEDAVKVAKAIVEAKNLSFAGIQAYHGLNQHVRTHEARSSIADAVVAKVKLCKDALAAEGIDCKIITGGGTGSYPLEAASGVFNEIQPGSYIFMDQDYGNNNAEEGNHLSMFENSLFVMVSVVSTASMSSGWVVVDSGQKAFSFDSGNGRIVSHPDLVMENGGDDHIKCIGKPEALAGFKRGDKIKFIPGHCDPTVNMYRHIVAYRDEIVEQVWEVGSGPGF